MMTKKQMTFTTGLYIFCALIWTTNFFLSWYEDGMIKISTGLFGVSAVLFTISAVLSVLRLIRLSRKNTKAKEDN